MAQQAYYQQQMAMAQKGPLQPGQTIKLSQHTVTVERYLSQGGFAHVYLVRTATPVMGTTQHVLKRMAVADVATLAEVKKEVDIMRLLRGHPNIVHLLDSASRPLPNGQHEVYILMEFCQGGGIIDMMNRRLRERLTEKDILQIFVDVCEAVACMHSLQPALLHRDLKVENILQATETSFKLCDFGSAAPSRPKPPSTMEEIKLLEADLNRSTTLQYRAPEMVDVYLRRPIDEKSDVWALGVLLYKLCYYTTPFEAHGPLAILHVQYSIPGYPVYSKEMNALIGCMLRELGVQRPSVFEVLSVVHRMRGTKSQFNYARPQQIPPSPSIQPAQLQDSLIQTSAQRAQAQAQSQREKQLREQKEALDAMNMRRGRPNENHSQQQQVPPSAPPTTLSKAPALPSRQPLAPLTRSRPSKSGGSRDSEKGARAKQQQQQGSDSPRKGAATPITTTTLAPSSPRKSTAPLASPRKSTATTTSTPSRVQGAPPSPRKSSATPVKAPVGGVRVGPSSVGVRPSGAGTNGVKGLNTGGAKVPTKSPTTDFFNDPSWKHSSSTSDEKEKDIWGGETVSSPATATATPTTTTTTNKFDGFADSFDGINGSGTGSAGRSSGSKLAGVGGVALPGLHKPSSTSHHHPTHHQPTIQQPKTTRTATRDAFEGLGIPSAPSPALSLRELAARSPVPSPGVGHGGSVGGSLSPMPGLSGSPMPSSLSPTPGAGVLGQSPTPFSRSPHPLTTGATASTGVTGTLTTQATAGSATSGSKGALALSAEERFPSIEELDAGTWQDKTKDREPSVPKLPPRPKPTREDSKPSVPTTTTRPGAVTQRSHLTGPNSHGLRPPVQGSGSRSQQVTGTAMKDPERVGATTTGTGAGTNGTTTPKVSRALPVPPATTTNTGPASTTGLGLLRRPSNGGAGPGVRRVSSIGSKNREESSPSPTRRAAGSPSKPPTSPAKPRPSSVIQTSSGKPAIAPKPALTPKPGGRAQSQTTRPDWLTGDFLETAAAMGISVPESPSKRSSALLGTATGGGGGGGAGTRYQAPLKSPAGENLGRSTPDPLGRATPNRLRAATSMTESSNDEGPEDPVAPYGRAKLERRGALTRSSPERKSRSSTLDVPISTGNTPTSSPAHRRGPSENLIDLGSNNVKSSRPVRTPSTASSNASHPPTSGPRSRRPQSMFIQAGTPISAALTPPVDPNAATKRSVRRGSISDMVSRYEALASPTVENQTTGSGGVQRRPSITPKPAGLRVPSTKVPPPERRRSPSPVATRPRSPVAARPRSPERIEREIPITRDVPITTPTTASTSVFNRENRTRTSPTEMMRDVPIQDGNARAPSPAGRRSRPPSPIKMTHPVVQPTPSRTSRAPLHTITPPHAKEEPQATRAPSPPPSPDKPYQGVGRLIDQWQKKAGAEPGRPLGPRVGRR